MTSAEKEQVNVDESKEPQEVRVEVDTEECRMKRQDSSRVDEIKEKLKKRTLKSIIYYPTKLKNTYFSYNRNKSGNIFNIKYGHVSSWSYQSKRLPQTATYSHLPVSCRYNFINFRLFGLN